MRDERRFNDWSASEINAELHTEVEALKKEREALAVKSATMLRLLTDISDNHGEFVNDADDYMYASVPLDYVSEINMYVSRDVNAENPFSATDTSIANIHAQGVDMAITVIKTMMSATAPAHHAIGMLKAQAAQLRKESNHD